MTPAPAKHPRSQPPLAIAGTAAGPRLDIIRASQVRPTTTEWVWPLHIPAGKLTIIGGLPGCGKSLLTTDAAARITRGQAWPDSERKTATGRVLLLAMEDSVEDVIVPRAIAAGVDLDRLDIVRGISTPDGTIPIDSRNTALIGQYLEQHTDTRAVIIDPIGGFLDGSRDGNSEGDVRGAVAPLVAMAETSGAAFILVAHIRKAEAGHALHRLSGSQALGALARCAQFVLPAREDDPDIRVLATVKNNLSRYAKPLRFRVVDGPRLEWLGESESTAEDLLDKPKAHHAPKQHECEEFIRQYVGENTVQHRHLEAAAHTAGHGGSFGRVVKRVTHQRQHPPGIGGISWRRLSPFPEGWKPPAVFSQE